MSKNKDIKLIEDNFELLIADFRRIIHSKFPYDFEKKYKERIRVYNDKNIPYPPLEKAIEKIRSYYDKNISKHPSLRRLFVVKLITPFKEFFLDQTKEIELFYLSQVNKSSENLDYLFSLASFYRWSIKDYNKAIVYLNKIYVLDPTFNDDIIAFNLSLCYERINEIPKAISLIDDHIRFIENEEHNQQLLSNYYYSTRARLKMKINDLDFVNDFLVDIKHNKTYYTFCHIANYFYKYNDLKKWKKYILLYLKNEKIYNKKPKKIQHNIREYILYLSSNGDSKKALSLISKYMTEELNSNFDIQLYSYVNMIHFRLYQNRLNHVNYGKKLPKTTIDPIIKKRKKNFDLLNKKLTEFLKNNSEGANYKLKNHRSFVPKNEKEQILIYRSMVKFDFDLYYVTKLFKRSYHDIFSSYLNHVGSSIFNKNLKL